MFNEKATSPVLGIIFMVFLTLITASVMTSFVLGVSASLDRTEEQSTAIFFDTSNSNSVDEEPIFYNGEQIYNVTQCNGNQQCILLFNE